MGFVHSEMQKCFFFQIFVSPEKLNKFYFESGTNGSLSIFLPLNQKSKIIKKYKNQLVPQHYSQYASFLLIPVLQEGNQSDLLRATPNIFGRPGK